MDIARRVGIVAAALTVALPAGAQGAGDAARAAAGGADAATPAIAELNRTGEGRGVVDRRSVDARGRLVGLVLGDGTDLVAPGGQGARLAAAAPPGTPVRVAFGLADTLRVENLRTGAAVDVGPLTLARGGGPTSAVLPPPPVAPPPELPRHAVQGRLAYVTYALGGDPSGLVLDTGVQVHLSRRVSRVLEGLAPGAPLRVEGRGVRGPHGLSLQATRIARADGGVVLDVQRGPGGE